MLSSILEVELSADSVENAVDKALAEFECSRAEVEITILKPPSRGFLGLFGKKPALVKVRLVDRGFIARRVTVELLALAGIPGSVRVHPARDRVELMVDSPESSLIIGRHGQTLDALQSLVRSFVDRWKFSPEPIFLDVGGYRARRIASLQRLTRRLATRTRISGNPAPLPSLTPDEQQVVQQIIKQERGIDFRSVGRGGQRRLMLLPKG